MQLVVGTGGPRPDTVPAMRIPAETTVVPAGTTVDTRLVRGLSARWSRPGDTIYLRVASAVLVRGRLAIPAGSFLEASVTRIAEQTAPDRSLELDLRIRRLLLPNGDIQDLFGADGTPNDRIPQRGVTGIATGTRSPNIDVVTTRVPVTFVADRAFIVDPRRSLASAFGRDVRVVGSPPRLECLSRSVDMSMPVTIPGTPGTPAIGDMPATPGTPDILLPGAPLTTQTWVPCS